MSSALHAMVRNGEIIAGHGAHIVVPWWSYAKTVLAAAALTLVRDRILELDTAIDGERFTLRQLLQHRAGLPDYGELREYHVAVSRGDTPWPAAELIERTDAGRLRYEPGQEWRYSNVGYLWVRNLIERAADAPLDNLLTSRVLEPLGISRTKLAIHSSDLFGIEMGQAENFDPGWVYHGLLVGPVFEAALLLDRLIGGALLPPHFIAEMQRAHPVQEVMPDRPWRSPAYGLGLMMDSPLGAVGHTGGGPGSVIAVYRSRGECAPGTTAVFAANGSAGQVEHLAFAKLRNASGVESDS